jgi:hypothetical protein
MNDTPPQEPERLRIPRRAFDVITSHVQNYGQQEMESGGFLLTAPRQARVQVLALAGSAGIVRGAGLFIITAPALDRLFTHAETDGLQVRAMFHSHRAEAFLSPTDRRYSLRAQGFINAVVPDYATPTADPAAWGWWRHDNDWVTCPPAQITPDDSHPLQVVAFDAEGLHAQPDGL